LKQANYGIMSLIQTWIWQYWIS